MPKKSPSLNYESRKVDGDRKWHRNPVIRGTVVAVGCVIGGLLAFFGGGMAAFLICRTTARLMADESYMHLMWFYLFVGPFVGLAGAWAGGAIAGRWLSMLSNNHPGAYSLPKVTIYVPRSAGTFPYLIQRQLEHPKFEYSQTTGDPLQLNRKEMEERGASVVSSILSQYPMQQDLGISSLNNMDATERRQFFQSYSEVLVTQLPEKQLELRLIKLDEADETGSGENKDAISVPIPFTSEMFTNALDTVVLPEIQGPL